MWSTRSAAVSTWPYSIVTFVRIPRPCARRWIDRYRSPEHLFRSFAIFFRTRSAKISAPPPGSESRPAAMSARSTCSSVIPYRSAKNAISTAVKHFNWTSGRIRLKPRSISV